MKKTVVLLSFVLCACIFFAALKFNAFANQKLDLQAPSTLVVNTGDSPNIVIHKLIDQEIISCQLCAKVFLVVYRPFKIFPGEYILNSEMRFIDLVQNLETQKMIEYKITLVEGWNLRKIIDQIWSNDKIIKTLSSNDPQKILKQLDFLDEDKKRLSAEGLFFPATYFFSKGVRDVDLLNRAYKKMRQVLQQAWQNRAQDLPYKSPYEALIMASIIEKESGAANERGEIAGVFVRRLKLGMLLQTDPTVIYGMGDRYKGNIRRRDLQRPTIYNTYVHPGLPPTPIAAAGKAAIVAALHPKEGSSLYFVADGEGGHVFSDTLSEHRRAVRRYVRQQRNKNK